VATRAGIAAAATTEYRQCTSVPQCRGVAGYYCGETSGLWTWWTSSVYAEL